MVANPEVAILVAQMVANPEVAILVARMVANPEVAILVVRMAANLEVAILVARMAASQEVAILVVPMAAGQEDAIPVARMAADREGAIPPAPVVARTDGIPAALLVAARKIADPGAALLPVANCLAVAIRLDAPLHRVGSRDVRRPPTGLARAVFPLQTPAPRDLAAGEQVDRRRPAAEDAAPKTEAPTDVGLTILARTVEGQVDQPHDRVVLSGRWARGDRASASWDRHLVVGSRRRVDPAAASPRSAAAFHRAGR